MSQLLIFLGILVLVVAPYAVFTKNEDLMKPIIKRKTNESSEQYLKRALTISIIFGGIALIGGFISMLFLENQIG